MTNTLSTCARAGCGEKFEPRTANHIYHHPSCRRRVEAEAKRVGLAPRGAQGEPQLHDADMIRVLQERGYRVDKPLPVERRLRLAPMKTKRFRLGVISDTHLGSKFQQLTHLNSFFSVFEKESVDAVVHGGDITHGSHHMHKGMEYEIFVHGADAQVDYAVENFPRSPAPAYIISGNHDLSFMKDAGTDTVQQFCQRRDDFTYLGEEGANLEIGGAKIYLWHGGSAAYAKSYNMQKWAEAVAPEEKPHIVLDGHLHFQCHVHHRGIECFQLPCTQSQTPFEKRKKLFPVVGAAILDLWMSKDGLEDIQTRWIIRRIVVPNDY